MERRREAWLGVLLTLTLAACGGDDDEGGTSSAASSGSASPPASGSPPPPSSGSAPPSISGSPPKAVVVGERYAFAPSASDADGDRLTFSIAQKPQWLSFSTAKGSLTGRPSAADVGTYRGIVITVTDGKYQRALPPFDIEVASVGSRIVTLQWLSPTENEDGSPLTDLAGFEITYGRQPGTYTSTIDVPNPGLTTYVVSGLVPGAYYFAMVAYNDTNVRSRYSGELAVQVQ